MIGTTLTRPKCPPSQGEGISCVGRHTLAAGLSPDFHRDKLGLEECGLEDGGVGERSPAFQAVFGVATPNSDVGTVLAVH